MFSFYGIDGVNKTKLEMLSMLYFFMEGYRMDGREYSLLPIKKKENPFFSPAVSTIEKQMTDITIRSVKIAM